MRTLCVLASDSGMSCDLCERIYIVYTTWQTLRTVHVRGTRNVHDLVRGKSGVFRTWEAQNARKRGEARKDDVMDTLEAFCVFGIRSTIVDTSPNLQRRS